MIFKYYFKVFSNMSNAHFLTYFGKKLKEKWVNRQDFMELLKKGVRF